MRIAWIFGSSRSGSSWLLHMLSDLEGVVPIDDPHLGHHLGVWRPIPLAWAIADGEPPELRTLLDVKADEPGYFFAERHRDRWSGPLRELIAARFAAQADDLLPGEPDPLCLVKEPGSQAAPLLAGLFPDSKLIFLLRDGRDVVDSWLDAYRDGSWAIPGGAFAVAPEGRIALIRWLATVWVHRSRAVARAFEQRDPADRVLVRYERLRIDTEACLEEIRATLGLPAAGLAEAAARHRFERLPDAAAGPGNRARLARPGSWRENLSPAEQDAMHDAFGDALEELGYEPARPRGAGRAGGAVVVGRGQFGRRRAG